MRALCLSGSRPFQPGVGALKLVMQDASLLPGSACRQQYWMACLGGRLRAHAVQVLKLVKVDRVLTWRFWFVRILPVGFFMALTLHFGNIVYLYLTVAFIQMLKVRRWSLFPQLSSLDTATAQGMTVCGTLRPGSQRGAAVESEAVSMEDGPARPLLACAVSAISCCA